MTSPGTTRIIAGQEFSRVDFGWFSGHRHCLQRAILFLDKDIHRPPDVRCDC